MLLAVLHVFDRAVGREDQGWDEGMKSEEEATVMWTQQ